MFLYVQNKLAFELNKRSSSSPYMPGANKNGRSNKVKHIKKAHIAYLDICVGGVKVSMVAFQAVDPGSIPGRRTRLLLDTKCFMGDNQMFV